MEIIKEFLQFQFFVAEDVLSVIYLICVIMIPFVAWYFLFWIIRRYVVVMDLYKTGRYSLFFSILLWVISKIRFFQNKIEENITWNSLSLGQKLKFIGLFLVLVGLSEILLRLTFEYLIAFMQMHDLLKSMG